VDRAGRRAINIPLSMTIHVTALALLFRMIGAFAGAPSPPTFFPLLHGGVLIWLQILFDPAVTLVATVRAARGEGIDYPGAIRIPA
jgi:uncharacterized Tic20 family protein